MNGPSARDYVAALVGVLPEPLVPVESVSAAATAAWALPARLGEYFGFECPLGPRPPGSPPPGADFLVGVRQRDRAALAAAAGSGPVWARVIRFAQVWATPGSVLADRVDNVWLEFDTGSGGPEAAAVPSVFFGTDRLGAGAAGAEDPGWLTGVALPLLCGELPAGHAAALLRCVADLPPSGAVFQVGRMLGRADGATRICVSGLAPPQVRSWLAAVGLSHRPDVAELLDRFTGLVDGIDVDVDVADRVGPRIGLECSFRPRRDPGVESRWTALLDLLEELDLCTAERRAGLLAACGWDGDDGVRPWPSPQRELDGLVGGASVSVRSRHLHHIKISTEPGRPPTAKAYLEIAHHRAARPVVTAIRS